MLSKLQPTIAQVLLPLTPAANAIEPHEYLSSVSFLLKFLPNHHGESPQPLILCPHLWFSIFTNPVNKVGRMIQIHISLPFVILDCCTSERLLNKVHFHLGSKVNYTFLLIYGIYRAGQNQATGKRYVLTNPYQRENIFF